MIIVTQTQLRNKDTKAIILLRNEIKASFNTNAIDYFTISAVAEILYNITVKVDDEDDKYNEMTIRLGIKTAIQRHLRFASLHHNSNVNIERDFKV